MQQIWRQIAAISLFLLAASSFVAPAHAQSREEQRREATAARDVPIIGSPLLDAVYARHGGRCSWRLNYLRRATENLEFYKRYLRANPGTDKVSQEDIARAQRALDREKRRPCNPSSNEQQFQTDMAALPALTGAVYAMPSQYPSTGHFQERHIETRTALDAIFDDKSKCQVELARRWLENHRQLLRELRLRRDAALAAGAMASIDPVDAHRAVVTMRSVLEVAEDRFNGYRIRCMKSPPRTQPEDSTGEESQGGQQQQESQQGGQCVPEGAGSGCDYVAPPGCTEGTEPQCDFEPRCYENDSGGCDYRLPEAPPAPCESSGEGCSWNQPLTGEEQAMLDAHNRARHVFGVPPLLWDDNLAHSAAEYAMVIAETGQLVHAPREGREHERENLLATQIGYRSPTDMIEVMVVEKELYKPGIYPDVSTTGDWYDVGHYTQIVWPWTTHVGCAIASSEFFDYTVCRYTPPGNRDGNPLYPGGNAPPEEE